MSYLVFEEYIKEHLENNGRNVAHYVAHPINFKNTLEPTESQNYIFAINVDPDSNAFEKVRKYGEANQLAIYVKYKDTNLEHKGCTVQKYYENYEEKLRNASIVVLQINYDYRISGVFYECLMFNKKIVFLGNEGLFQREMHLKYPHNTAMEDMESTEKMEPSNQRFFEKHEDQKVLDELMSIMSTQNRRNV